MESEEDYDSSYMYLDKHSLPCYCLNGEFGKLLNSTDVDLSSFGRQTPLCRACNFGWLKAVKMVIEAGANVNTKDHTNWTPLHEAAWVGSIAVCKYLLQDGADVTTERDHVMLPLHIACREGHLGVIRVLENFMKKKENSVNPFNVISNGQTPLICAVTSNRASLAVVKYLIDKGADVNIPSDTNLLPLHFAVTTENCDIYDLIKSKTKYDILLKYCNCPETIEIDENFPEESFWDRNIFCRAVFTRNKHLIERTLKLGLPNEVLNSPQIVYNTNAKEDGKKYISFSPFSLFLGVISSLFVDSAVDFLKMSSDNNIYIIETLISSDMRIGPIETVLLSPGNRGVKLKLINYFLRKGADPDEGYSDHQRNPQFGRCKNIDYLNGYVSDTDEGCIKPPTELLKICIKMGFDKHIIMLLLKTSNVVEPEDLLGWIVANRNRNYIPCVEQDMVYVLLTLSPYFTVTPCMYEFFMNLSSRCDCLQEGNVLDKIKQIYVQPVRSLANYCRSVIRRQLHFETRNNRNQFTERLNSLDAPKVIISYLKFSEVKFTECPLAMNY